MLDKKGNSCICEETDSSLDKYHHTLNVNFVGLQQYDGRSLQRNVAIPNKCSDFSIIGWRYVAWWENISIRNMPRNCRSSGDWIQPSDKVHNSASCIVYSWTGVTNIEEIYGEVSCIFTMKVLLLIHVTNLSSRICLAGISIDLSC